MIDYEAFVEGFSSQGSEGDASGGIVVGNWARLSERKGNADET
jgi:hypothetical protein